MLKLKPGTATEGTIFQLLTGEVNEQNNPHISIEFPAGTQEGCLYQVLLTSFLLVSVSSHN